jgi:hypothetical protein
VLFPPPRVSEEGMSMLSKAVSLVTGGPSPAASPAPAPSADAPPVKMTVTIQHVLLGSASREEKTAAINALGYSNFVFVHPEDFALLTRTKLRPSSAKSVVTITPIPRPPTPPVTGAEGKRSPPLGSTAAPAKAGDNGSGTFDFSLALPAYSGEATPKGSTQLFCVQLGTGPSAPVFALRPNPEMPRGEIGLNGKQRAWTRLDRGTAVDVRLWPNADTRAGSGLHTATGKPATERKTAVVDGEQGAAALGTTGEAGIFVIEFEIVRMRSHKRHAARRICSLKAEDT